MGVLWLDNATTAKQIPKFCSIKHTCAHFYSICADDNLLTINFTGPYAGRREKLRATVSSTPSTPRAVPMQRAARPEIPEPEAMTMNGPLPTGSKWQNCCLKKQLSPEIIWLAMRVPLSWWSHIHLALFCSKFGVPEEDASIRNLRSDGDSAESWRVLQEWNLYFRFNVLQVMLSGQWNRIQTTLKVTTSHSRSLSRQRPKVKSSPISIMQLATAWCHWSGWITTPICRAWLLWCKPWLPRRLKFCTGCTWRFHKICGQS